MTMTNYVMTGSLAIALEKLDFIESNQGSLAGKSTINRLEYCR